MTTPQVTLTNFEVVRILAGHPMTCSDLDGNPIVVRLSTAAEFVAANRKAIASIFPNGGGPEPVTYAQAVQLTTPIGGVS